MDRKIRGPSRQLAVTQIYAAGKAMAATKRLLKIAALIQDPMYSPVKTLMAMAGLGAI